MALDRQIDAHRRTLTDPALDFDASGVPLNDTPDNGEPQPDARNFVRPASNSSKWFENMRKLLLRDTHPVIGDLKQRVIAIGFEFHVDLTAARRILNGVADQIIQHLFHTKWI